MSKRAFEREDGVLLDRVRRADGTSHTSMFASSMLGESIDPALRAVLLAREASGTEGLSDNAIYALSDEASPEYLDALLAAVENGGVTAPYHLVRFGDDPRVRPTLLRALEDADSERLPNLVQAVGMLGIEGARGALEARLAALEADPETFAAAPYVNESASVVQAIASALLELDGGHPRAAKALARLCVHPCAFNRQTAAMTAVAALERPVRDDARQTLLAALMPFTAGDDDLAFLNAAPAVIALDPPVVKARLERLVRDVDATVRLRAVNTLRRCAVSEPAWAERWLQERVAAEDEPATALEAVAGAAEAPAEGRVEQIVRAGLASASPTARLTAIRGLDRLSSEQAGLLARTALEDEPDPALRRMLAARADEVR